MKVNKNQYYRLILFTLIGIMLIPLVVKKLELVHEKPLLGDVQVSPDTSFSLKNWFFGDYALIKEKYLNDNFGYRNDFVRFRNQFYFSVFGKIFAKEVMCGKDGFLFESKYLKAHAGLDYVGEEKIKSTCEKLRFIQDTLAKKGIKFLVVFAPGKASFYPEFIPAPYNIKTYETNYYKYNEFASKYELNYIDFNALFLKLKPKAKFPLYPKTGTHWSIYSMHLVFDSINNYLSKSLKRPLAKFDYTSVTQSYQLRHPDGDIGDGLNLFEEVPHFNMAYPNVKWIDTAGVFKPRVLTVADSYWMGIYFLDLPEHVYTDHTFWYYNSQVYSKVSATILNSCDYDLKESVESNDVIIILSTEATLKQIGWGFIDELYTIYKSPADQYEFFKSNRKRNLELTRIRINIANNTEWFKSVKKQAYDLKISVDSCLQMNAEYFYNNHH